MQLHKMSFTPYKSHIQVHPSTCASFVQNVIGNQTKKILYRRHEESTASNLRLASTKPSSYFVVALSVKVTRVIYRTVPFLLSLQTKKFPNKQWTTYSKSLMLCKKVYN